MTIVKICGITNFDDARHAVDCGADALGFNFYENSPRYINPARAIAIIDRLPPGVDAIGVFVNGDIDQVAEIVIGSRLDAVQLHGDESIAYVSEIAARTSLPVIKAFRDGPGFVLENVKKYAAGAILFDAHYKDLMGGTGKVADWSIAAKLRSMVRKLYLAGGLSAENIAAAINAVRPYAVDACSLLESEPGRKDHDKMARFIAVAKQTI